MKIPVLALVLPLFLLLSACGSRQPDSADFKAGYSDGCASANTEGGANKRDEGGVIRDEGAYRGNKDYRAGWGRGFGVCRAMTRQTSPAGSPGGGPYSMGPMGVTP
jgi:hypothetical protein